MLNDNTSTASQILVDIIRTYMALPQNAVWLRNQNKTIPNKNDLFVELGAVSAPVIGNNTFMATVDNVLSEVNEVQRQEAIQIDIFSSSYSNLAMDRNWEVIAALNSFYSQQKQEEANFKICRIPRNTIDTSSAEGGSMIQRYSITIICFVWYRKTKALENYYNDFNVRVDDEKSIGTSNPIVQFEIDPESVPPFEGD